jgi:TRAP-type mannitol/chloroaromatic compound transport system permease small subunit
MRILTVLVLVFIAIWENCTKSWHGTWETANMVLIYFFLKTILYSTCTLLLDAYISRKIILLPHHAYVHWITFLFVEQTWTIRIDSTNTTNLRIYFIYTGLLICISFHVNSCFVRKTETYFKRTKFYVLSKKGTKSPLQSPKRFSCGSCSDLRIMKALTTSVNQHWIS